MPEPSPPQAGGPVPAGRILSHIYEVGQILHSLDDPEALLARILDLALQILGAERGTVLLRSGEGDELIPAAVRGLEDETVAEAAGFSHTAVREALAGRPVVALDVGNDVRMSEVMSVSLYDIRSLVCVPLRLPDQVLGVIYIDSRRPGARFQDDDLRFLNAFAAQAAMALHSARLYRRLRRENHRLSRQARVRGSYEGLLGRSDAMQQVYDLLDRAGESPFPALLLGETGTGKELAARALHRRSPRRSRPFLAVNCAAFSESLLESELFGHVRGAFTGADNDRKGVFELAHGGVLFLDEVGGMSRPMQAKLLRVLQDGDYRPLGGKQVRRADVRILAATHLDLDMMVKEESFREDLFYRLNVIRVLLPPLRQRREDIPLLVEHFIERSIGKGSLQAPRIEASALRELTAHAWPGNVRELEHTVQRLVLTVKGGKVDGATVRKLLPRLPTADGDSSGFPSLKAMEARHIARALEICGGNREEAARRLGIGRATIYRKMKEFDVISQRGRTARGGPPHSS